MDAVAEDGNCQIFQLKTEQASVSMLQSVLYSQPFPKDSSLDSGTSYSVKMFSRTFQVHSEYSLKSRFHPSVPEWL
jgi:hypothetical protein